MAFVHLHNHSDFSLLNGAMRIPHMVKRAVELKMPAVALTDYGFMYGIPNLALETDKYNHAQADYQQWFHDKENFSKGREVKEPDPSDTLAHKQWELDFQAYQEGRDLDEVRPEPLIKPIFGCEVFITPDNSLARDRKPELYHLVLLAKSQLGYINLMQIVSDAATRGFYYKPRVTLDILRKHAEGLIALSACSLGAVSLSFIRNSPEDARMWAQQLKDIFAPGDFYLELEDHGVTHEHGFTDRELNHRLVDLARELDIKLVASNDVHYLDREDAKTQDLLLCIGLGEKVDEVDRPRLEGDEYYFKSEEEMRELFDWIPEALDNSLEIAQKCQVELEWDKIILPRYPLDPGETNESQFRRECERGLARRYGDDWRERRKDVLERFEYEYKVICDKGFAAYFLIVADYVRWAKENGIGVGPGRGSAAGAIVAYAMDITTFDPLENGLMFERFLSPERAEMPDIDMDFDDERRPEVIEYVRQRYGAERVCHVITYSTIKAKQAINDAARILDYPLFRGQKLSKMIPFDPKVTLSQVLYKDPKHPDLYNPDLGEQYKKDEDDRQIIDAAISLEGLIRGEGVHACAILICRDPVNLHVPTKLDTKGRVEITEYEGSIIASMGLLKMDFLGLRTLTVISRAKQNIKKNHGIDINIDEIPFDDPKIFELLTKGHTAGVFQVESAGMTATIKSMRPREYKHVVALIALYRPGPLGAGMVDDYVARMNGKKGVVYYDPRLASILEETYGTIVYQEQVMQISMRMSGFSAGESDKVRKAVAKKHIELMETTVQHWEDGADETMRDHWMNGAVRNGYTRQVAERIWADVLKFASYAFNKSHSAGYAILVMQTAWLKAHYPKEYMAAVLTSYMGKTDKIVHYINACKHEQIQVLPPDINESGIDFTAVDEGIRFGFAGIRGVGEGSAEAIIQEREKNGPYKNLHNFISRVDLNQVNRRVVEALILSGAFDSTGYPRLQLMSLVDKTNPENFIDTTIKFNKRRANGQRTLFDLMNADEDYGLAPLMPPVQDKEWDRHYKLAQEKEILGIYVSDHPLSPYEVALSKARDHSIAQIEEFSESINPETGTTKVSYTIREGKPFWLAGMITSLSKKVTKDGKEMAIAKLADMEGEVDLVIFPKTFTKKVKNLLMGEIDSQTGETIGDVFVKVLGKLERSDRGNQMIVSRVESLELSDEANRKHICEVHLSQKYATPAWLQKMRTVFERYPGLDLVELVLMQSGIEQMRIELPLQVDAANRVFMAELRDLLHGEVQVHVA